jgi:hypothetical protein
VGPWIEVRSTKVQIDAIRVGRTCAEGQLGQALDRGAVRLGQRNRLIGAGAISETLPMAGVRILPRRWYAPAETFPGGAAATSDREICRPIPRDRPSTRRRGLRAGESQDDEPALHPNVSRHRATSFSWLIICALPPGQDQPEPPSVLSGGVAGSSCQWLASSSSGASRPALPKRARSGAVMVMESG